MKVLIVGSCVSRDAFTVGDPDILVVDYYARTSLASQAARQPSVKLNIGLLPSKFQQNMVRRDIEKNLLTGMEKLEFDVLVLDLIDERFDLLIFPDGSILTQSSEGIIAQKNASLGPTRIVKSGCPEFLERWTSGWMSFLRKLIALGWGSKLLIHKTFWDTGFPSKYPLANPSYSTDKIRNANQVLTSLYKLMEETIPREQWIDMEPYVCSDVNHRWGPSPFHFSDDYYCRLRELVRRSWVTKGSTSEYSGSHSPRRFLAGHRRLASSEFFRLTEFSDDRYWIEDSSGHLSFDLRTDYAQQDSKCKLKPISVWFGGAVTERDMKEGPFYSGAGVAKELGFSSLAIADPTVTDHDHVGLAWYAGDRKNRFTQLKIALVIEHLARLLGAYPLLIGGSGGGFAALALSGLLQVKHSVLIWNPQTKIALYEKKPVLNYLTVSADQNQEGADEADISISLRNTGSIIEFTQSVNFYLDAFVYLQNISDWHASTHLARLLTPSDLDLIEANSIRLRDSKGVVWLGNWGVGHVPPPRDIIKTGLTALGIGLGSEAACERLSAMHPAYAALGAVFDPQNAASACTIDAKRAGKILDLNITGVPTSAQVAIYIRAGKAVIHKSWYSYCLRRQFNLDLITESSWSEMTATIFILDSFGRKGIQDHELNIVTREM